MVPHFHGGASMFIQTVIYTIIGVNLVRLGAAKLTDHPKTESIGRALGSLVTWGGSK